MVANQIKNTSCATANDRQPARAKEMFKKSEFLNTPKYCVLDIEASGLGSGSYPIEIGITLDNGVEYQSLISPVAEWSHWDKRAEAIHGISYEDVMRYGRSVQDVCEDINRLCEGKTLISDCWVYDKPWYDRLFGAAGIAATARCSAIEFVLDEQQLAMYQHKKNLVARMMGLEQHRALNDALIIQHTLMALDHGAANEDLLESFDGANAQAFWARGSDVVSPDIHRDNYARAGLAAGQIR